LVQFKISDIARPQPKHTSFSRRQSLVQGERKGLFESNESNELIQLNVDQELG
jgi:hypothetical protein